MLEPVANRVAPLDVLADFRMSWVQQELVEKRVLLLDLGAPWTLRLGGQGRSPLARGSARLPGLRVGVGVGVGAGEVGITRHPLSIRSACARHPLSAPPGTSGR